MQAGENNPFAKLTWRDVREIRKRYAAGGITQRALALEYGVHQSALSLILTGRRWQEQPVA